METAWRPHMFATPFFKMGKFFPGYSACSAFQSFGNKTERILRRVFEKYMDMDVIRQQRHCMPVMAKFFGFFLHRRYHEVWIKGRLVSGVKLIINRLIHRYCMRNFVFSYEGY